MLRTRIIPCLLLKDDTLVKTVKFKNEQYIGDPLNTCRIFNELEVDEMMILDITASKRAAEPNFKVLHSLVSECFMPLSYGGGITKLSQAEQLFYTGFEKIVLNSILYSEPQIINNIAKVYGSQSVIASVDVRKGMFSGYQLYSHSGSTKQKPRILEWAKQLEDLGAGEILLTGIDNEGTWKGFDTNLIKMVSDTVGIPVIANGGAGSIDHIADAVHNGHASAVSLGSMVVFQNKGMGVLVNFPDKRKLYSVLAK
jgi:imidazole glycerol-phosphate synthase subunit HisF